MIDDQPAETQYRYADDHPADQTDHPCGCGRVCVCGVGIPVIRSVASFVAEWHPSRVLDDDLAAQRAEDASACRCGQVFCGYRKLARTLMNTGAIWRGQRMAQVR